MPLAAARGPHPLSSLAGADVLVTGATGSFGHAFVRRALTLGVRRIVCLSRDELKQARMAQTFPDPRVRFVLGDVRDRERLDRALWNVDTVIHAAALKRVDHCRDNPEEAIKTNLLGSMHVAMAAIDAGVSSALLLSTDKAPAPATLYGGTKFLAEQYWSQSNVYAAGRPTRLSSVRYGNVLGSRGSVLELWRTQAQAGTPLTLTDARCTRFWLTLDHAVDLVLVALDTMRGGDTLIAKVPSSNICALATAVSREWSAAPPTFTETGLRVDERLHETLISADESRTTFDCGTHYVIEPQVRSWGDDVASVPGVRVADGFSYRSDTNPQQASADELAAMLATVT